MTIDADVLVGFRRALREGIAHDLERTRSRHRRARRLTVAAAAAAVVLALVLAQPFGRGQSALARARAALDFPAVGVLHVTWRGAGGRVSEEVWQSLQSQRAPQAAGRPTGRERAARRRDLRRCLDAL